MASSVRYLASSVDDLSVIILAFMSNDLAKGVFDCRVIAFDEVAIDELYGQRRFA